MYTMIKILRITDLSLIFTIFNFKLNLVLLRGTLDAMISILVVRFLIHTDLNRISPQVVRFGIDGFPSGQVLGSYKLESDLPTGVQVGIDEFCSGDLGFISFLLN